jgi:hypothetical protein
MYRVFSLKNNLTYGPIIGGRSTRASEKLRKQNSICGHISVLSSRNGDNNLTRKSIMMYTAKKRGSYENTICNFGSGGT